MALGLKLDDGGAFRLKVRRMQAGVQNVKKMEQALFEEMLLEGEHEVKMQFLRRVGEGSTATTSRSGYAGRTGRTYGAITHRRTGGGMLGKVYVSREGGLYGPPVHSGVFYPLVFEYGKKGTSYYGRHFFRDGIRNWRKKMGVRARISLNTMKGELR